MNWIGTLWRGDYSLPRTYWLFGIVITWAVTFLYMATPVGSTSEAIATLPYVGWLVLVWVAIWRSSDKYTGPVIWRALSKIVVVLGVLSFIIGFLEGAGIAA